MLKNNIRVTRCYLVEAVDKEEKAYSEDFCFGTKEDALALGERLKASKQMNISISLSESDIERLCSVLCIEKEYNAIHEAIVGCINDKLDSIEFDFDEELK